jgi:hypothetical protein
MEWYTDVGVEKPVAGPLAHQKVDMKLLGIKPAPSKYRPGNSHLNHSTAYFMSLLRYQCYCISYNATGQNSFNLQM